MINFIIRMLQLVVRVDEIEKRIIRIENYKAELNDLRKIESRLESLLDRHRYGNDSIETIMKEVGEMYGWKK